MPSKLQRPAGSATETSLEAIQGAGGSRGIAEYHMVSPFDNHLALSLSVARATIPPVSIKAGER
jgi:hypothetical protein